MRSSAPSSRNCLIGFNIRKSNLPTKLFLSTPSTNDGGGAGDDDYGNDALLSTPVNREVVSGAFYTCTKSTPAFAPCRW